MNTNFTIPFATLKNAITIPLFNLGSQPIDILWLLKSLVLLAVVALVAKSSKQLLKRRLLAGFIANEPDRELISNLASFTLALIGVVFVMQAMGLRLESLAVIAGGLGIGIGFGLQELTKNMVSGITLLGERKLRVGDLIKFKGTEGYIHDISIRSTVIKTFHGSELIIPNTQLTESQVEKWGYQSGLGRIDIPVLIDQSSDLVLVTEILLRTAFMEANVLIDPRPKVIFKGFGETGFNFELWVWVDHIDRSATVKSALNFLIEYHFRQHGIKIAFQLGDSWAITKGFPMDLESGGMTQTKPLKTSLPFPIPALRDQLLHIQYFQDFDEIELRSLLELGYRKNLSNGEILAKQGEYHNVFCVVLKGAVDAIYENNKISQRMFTFQEGEFFGELPLLLNIPCPTSMHARGEVILFVIGAEGFHNLLGRYPNFKELVAEEMIKRQENIRLCQATLRSMGLLTDEHETNPVTWLRERLLRIWGNKAKVDR